MSISPGDRDLNPTLLEEVAGAGMIAFSILLSPVLRMWYSRWGSTPDERRRPLPGDDIVPQPRLESTRAVTIRAAAAEIWPWLAQMGQGRGGLYSYERLENLARCDMHNADRIHPEWQTVAVGDKVRFGPEPYPFQVVRAIDPGKTLVLGSPPQERVTLASWTFHLEPVGASQTRLIVRNRGSFGPGATNFIVWRLLTDPIFFVMERRMLIGIRDRAEVCTTRPALA